MNLIEAKNIVKVYRDGASFFKALDKVSINIKKGESVAIIGKSGSGKSTLMHLLALLDKPNEGQILINGKDTALLKKKELNKLRNQTFGFVFQQFFMNPQDTVLENVILPLKIAGVPSKKRKEIAMKALEEVELADKFNNKASNLSGGQKQRVCIARAIANSPKILFADEPTGNLDSNTGDKVEKLLFSLNKEQGITLIIVTHDEALANKCDRQIRIKDGKIVTTGKDK
ncbi:lipoprotein release ATP-binding component [Chlamydia trachomatis]|jgi:ABC transporter, ATP-binding protein|uniref:Lipoprotein-releasing system ATP-binding protein LolD n=1 Tax=Candidatus Nanogingivalis gingivitcus TaxID=2171992 RepID=A0ABY0FIU8_9BACT|nr:ABC transporter ATP-binding protein [Candidatus Nanogingivalis gingivitcus]RYC72860.1 Lipoprotein-releasing system ATP-binding protein LolD [Candidatus Nanogingivalis gingivitcus]CRH89941.1 lipoprotein release ATP-binding component [Chlamydia trachomatis]